MTMRVSHWNDYELIDASCAERLERWGDKILIRPDPQVIWSTPKEDKRWNRADAHYYRASSGGGHWDKSSSFASPWDVSYRDLTFKVDTLGFKHTGVFPEQAVNWDFCRAVIQKSHEEMNILNLFAYTGGATLACAGAGAKVCHVDSSKGMVAWAKENAEKSNLSDKPIRWIVDDCVKFVQREKRRGRKYNGIIMDPPSFGRGSNGELWKLEENLYGFLELCESVMAQDSQFLILNSYTTGLSPSVMEYLLRETIQKKRKGHIESDEIGLKVTASSGILPAGATSIWLPD